LIRLYSTNPSATYTCVASPEGPESSERD